MTRRGQPGPGSAPLELAVVQERVEEHARTIDANSRLLFLSLPEDCALPPSNSERVFYCVCDGKNNDAYVYQHFFADFGPLHLGHVYAFCKRLGELLKSRSSGSETVDGSGSGSVRPALYVCSSGHPHRRSNAVVLVLAFSVRTKGNTSSDRISDLICKSTKRRTVHNEIH